MWPVGAFSPRPTRRTTSSRALSAVTDSRASARAAGDSPSSSSASSTCSVPIRSWRSSRARTWDWTTTRRASLVNRSNMSLSFQPCQYYVFDRVWRMLTGGRTDDQRVAGAAGALGGRAGAVRPARRRPLGAPVGRGGGDGRVSVGAAGVVPPRGDPVAASGRSARPAAAGALGGGQRARRPLAAHPEPGRAGGEPGGPGGTAASPGGPARAAAVGAGAAAAARCRRERPRRRLRRRAVAPTTPPAGGSIAGFPGRETTAVPDEHSMQERTTPRGSYRRPPAAPDDVAAWSVYCDRLSRLWTPHRIAYVRGEDRPPGGYDRPGGCPFCAAARVPAGEELVVAHGTHVFAVLNRFPYNPGHLMVCPRRHVADYTDLTTDETAELAAFTQTAMRVIRQVSGAPGFNIGMNQG